MDWRCRWVTREPRLLALGQQHALTRRPRLKLHEVLSEPLVIFPRRIAPSLYAAVFALYHRAGQLPVVAQEAIQMQTIVNLVSAGLGLAWVPASVQQFQREGVVYRSVDDLGGAELPHSETSLVWREASGNPALQRLMEFLPPVPAA